MEHTSEYYRTKALNILVNGLAALFFLCCLAYAGYSLWDNWHVLSAADSIRDDLVAYRPTNEENLSYSFQELMALNPDVCAWIIIDNTNIDYPVVQGKDNFEYLDKNALGEDSASGSIFLDYQNSSDFTDFYTILMGHHMQGGKMFGDMDLFMDETFFRENVTGTLYLPDRILQLETAAFISADAYDKYLYRTDWSSGESRRELISYIYDTAIYTRGETLTPDDQIISLSTCASGSTNARMLLICRVTGVSYAEEGSEDNIYEPNN